MNPDPDEREVNAMRLPRNCSKVFSGVSKGRKGLSSGTTNTEL